MSEFVIVRGRPRNEPPPRAFDPDEQLRQAAIADTAARAAGPTRADPVSDAALYERMRNEKLAAESGEGAARVAAAEAERRAREAPVIDAATVVTRSNYNRAQAVLRLVTTGTVDSLRIELG